jgi:hypothetical protein
MCLTDCTEIDKSRLLGYYQTCMGMTGLAAGDYKFVEGCSENAEYLRYAEKMRYCLQNKSIEFNDKKCHTCKEVVQGDGGPYSGIIGSHTPCNSSSGFCKLSEHSLRCFGAGLGSSWRGVLGSHSVAGSVRSVGTCHLLAQSAMCATTAKKGYEGFMTFWRSLCTGYQAGCVAMQKDTGTFIGNASDGLFGGGSKTFDVASCKASCPLPDDLNIVGKYGGSVSGYVFEEIAGAIGTGGVLRAEEVCRSVLGI